MVAPNPRSTPPSSDGTPDPSPASVPAPNNAAKGVSDRKRAANRANAQRSTGPRSDDGKTRARLNAMTHGLRAELPPEFTRPVALADDADAASVTGEYRSIRSAFRHDLHPCGAAEAFLVERLSRAAWRLRRAEAIEVELFDRLEFERASRFHRRKAKAIRDDKCAPDADMPGPTPGSTDEQMDYRSARDDVGNDVFEEIQHRCRQLGADDRNGGGAGGAPASGPFDDRDGDEAGKFRRDWLDRIAARQFESADGSGLLRLSQYQLRLEGTFRASLRQLRRDRETWEDDGGEGERLLKDLDDRDAFVQHLADVVVKAEKEARQGEPAIAVPACEPAGAATSVAVATSTDPSTASAMSPAPNEPTVEAQIVPTNEPTAVEPVTAEPTAALVSPLFSASPQG